MNRSNFIFIVAIFFVFSLNANSSAANCPEGELSFSFRNLEAKKAFAIFASFASLKAEVDQGISYTSPINFDCTPWKVAAQNLADRYNLDLRIENGKMHVSKK